MTNLPNFAHLPCVSVHSRGWACKWLHKVACVSCSHLRIDVQRASAVAFCSSLQLVVAGSLHGHANVCARFPLPF